MTGPEVIAALRQEGWEVKTLDGMQVKLTKGDRVVIVPWTFDGPLSAGLLQAIEKQTGVVLT